MHKLPYNLNITRRLHIPAEDMSLSINILPRLPVFNVILPVAGCLLLSVILFRDHFAWATLALTLAYLWPCISYIAQVRNNFRLFHPIVFFLLIWFIGFPFQLIRVLLGFLDYDDLSFGGRGDLQYVSLGLILSSIGLFAFVTAFFLVYNWALERKSNPNNQACPRDFGQCILTKIICTAWIAGMILEILLYKGLPMHYAPNEGLILSEKNSLLMIIHYARNIGLAGICCVILFWRQYAHDLWMKRLFWCGLFLEILLILGAGAKISFVRLALAIGIGFEYSNIRRSSSRWFRGYLVWAFLVIVFGFTIVNNYRNVVREENGINLSQSLSGVVTEQIHLFGKTLAEVFTFQKHGLPYAGSYTLKDAGDRLSLLSALIHVLSVADGQSPHENLDKVLFVPVYAVTPRSVMPGKVEFFNSGSFAQLNDWEWGGLSITLVGSLFWVGGPVAVIIGFAFYGAFLGYAWVMSYQKGTKGFFWLMLYVMNVLIFSNAGWDTLVIDNIRYMLLFGLIIHFVARENEMASIPA